MFPTERLRNIAIIAHVDHGKTTLVDRLLQQSGTLGARAVVPDRVMDSSDLERERGITILSKNTAIDWEGWRINIVDTPGHADFGGEVERVLSMVDGVLLLVDAVDGPMPQTRFVTQKAFARGFTPLVVINKIDRDGARPHWVLDQTFDLFDKLGATNKQLDFPVVYTSALKGYASLDSKARDGDMRALFETIVAKVPAPEVEAEGPLQLQISSLDYSSYVGVLGIGRVSRGVVRAGAPVAVVGSDGGKRNGVIGELFGFHGLTRTSVEEAGAGDIVVFSGIDDLRISDTITSREKPEALPALKVDEPTISMNFLVNKSPFAGKEGKFLTSRQIKARLEQELKHNVALRMETTDDPDRFKISGRGELHLAILIETMRREGYELAVSRPTVIEREVDGEIHEPWELVTVDMAEEYQGAVMMRLAERKGELRSMMPDGKGRARLEYRMPARGLIGFRTEYLTVTAGTGLLYHLFDGYAPRVKTEIGQRHSGSLVSMVDGKALAYALFNLQERGKLFIGHGEQVYEGMIVGVHSRGNDLPVNPTKAKQLTNIRAAGSDENILLTRPVRFSLEEALEFIDDDELVEVTPKSIRLRKKLLKESDRRRDARMRA
ncbi:MAG TPA: translational GTPase TypA [Gammaproteobacteria bacterium]|nr:translational GTPase TypA [Gammaproteobacteria bacterium]